MTPRSKVARANGWRSAWPRARVPTIIALVGIAVLLLLVRRPFRYVGVRHVGVRENDSATPDRNSAAAIAPARDQASTAAFSEDTDRPPRGSPDEDQREVEPLGKNAVSQVKVRSDDRDQEELADEQMDQALRAEQIDVAKRLAEEHPDNHNAAYLVGLVHQEQGDLGEALEAWNRCRQLNPDRADLFNSMGYAHVMKAELGLAITAFSTAISIQPSLAEARVRLADALMQQGQAEEVVSTLQTELGSSPRAYLLLGQAHQQLNEHEEARQALSQAVSLDPNLADAHYALAKVCAQLKDAEGAKRHHEQFRKLKAHGQRQGRDWRRVYNPLAITRRSVAHTHTDVARVYQSLGNRGQAERLLRRAAEVDPANTDCRIQLALLLQRTRRVIEALQICEELCRSRPEIALHHFSLGNANMVLKRYIDAERAYKKVIELEPERGDGYRALAQCYLVANNSAGAASLAREAAQRDPSAPVYALLAEACARAGDLAGASDAWRQALKLAPGNAAYKRRYELLQQRK